MKMPTISSLCKTLAVLSTIFIAIASSHGQPVKAVLERLVERKLAQLMGPVTAHYSVGAKERASKLQTDIQEMSAFFYQKLGVHSEVTLAVLNRGDWRALASGPYGLPFISDQPSVIFLPADSGGFAFEAIMARRESIPAAILSSYLQSSGKTYEAAADDYVDIIGFHEVGHALSYNYGIYYRHCRWLNEFVATYFAYTFISERKPDSKRVFVLCGRPTKGRPKNTTLADFERLYNRVDDYGWYQGMFDVRVQELYAQMGIRFLEELRDKFPGKAESKEASEGVLEKMESIAPGFRAWARGFEPSSATDQGANKAPEPTPGAVTPRATEGVSR